MQGANPELPPILLVHGFGAFGEHWRGNINALAAAGFRVLAPTYPGYGRSEKTMTTYGQGVWTDFLRDFVLDIVKAPVVVAGNSIGGFLSASMAADHPETVAGLVLVNSAGELWRPSLIR
jgi:pimeloyl-ACP methyl ester carboxylesterase